MPFKTPGDMVQSATRQGCAYTDASIPQQIVAGLLAGAYLALGALVATVGGGQDGILYAVLAPPGYLLAALAGGQLFVINCAIVTPACLAGAVRWDILARNWGLVYIGNIIGALVVALLFGYVGGVARGGEVGAYTVAVTESLSGMGWGALLLRGIGGGWLIGLAAWLALSADSMAGRILSLWIPVAAYIAMGLVHIVTGAMIPLGLLNGAHVGIVTLIWSVLLPVSLGNLRRGRAVGAIYWWLYGRD